MSNELPNPGGEGGGATCGPDQLTRSEMRVLERVMRQGTFVITEKGLAEMPAMMEHMATSKRQCPRNRVGAARVIVQMARYNLDRERSILTPPSPPVEPPPGVNVNIHGDVNLSHEQLSAELAAYTVPLRQLLLGLLEVGASGGKVCSNGSAKSVDTP